MLSQDITESLLAVIMLQLVRILWYRFELWVDGSIQMWPHCRLKIVYCYGLRTWIFGRNPWTDANVRGTYWDVHSRKWNGLWTKKPCT